ncbi:MAG TPA: cupredoxin domain-containing protein [Thermomicrobiaceae bacterium]|nr:cupredoxin domain-containing protein [Thermomicrobiaceae bacterium]
MKAWSRSFAKVAVALAAIAVLAFALAACGGSSSSSSGSSSASSSASSSSSSSASSSSSSGGASSTISVTEKEYHITLSPATAKAGEVTFNIKNTGTIDHDIEVLQGTTSKGKTSLISPGKTATLKVNLSAGTYDVICTVSGHRALGMDTKLTVQ